MWSPIFLESEDFQRHKKAKIINLLLDFWSLAWPKKCKKNCVIKSATSVAFAKRGCASSRLDHCLNFYVIWEAALAADLFTDSRTPFGY